MRTYLICLRRGIGVGSSKDVRVAERRRTNGVRRRFWHRPASLQGRAPGIDGGTVRCVAHVVPDSRPIRPRGNGIDVVSQEFGDQTVRARASRIARSTPIQYSPSRWRSSRSDVRVQHDSIQATRGRGIGAVRGEECIIDHVEIGPIG